MQDRRRSAFVVATAILVLLAALALFPTPYYLLSPGTAVDLTSKVAVEGHAPARRQYFLTDVTVQRATALLLLGGFVPGTRLVKHDFLLPPGETLRSYDRVLTAAMNDSQHVAAYVAEHAAGIDLAVPVRRVVVVDLLENSKARGLIEIGDRLLRVRGKPIAGPLDTVNALHALRPGDRIAVDVERKNRIVHVSVPTIEFDNAPKLGIETEVSDTVPPLPVPVHFSLKDVQGSSGGLMFALAIYAALTGDRRATSPIAGTGTISTDGTVGPIEGTQQKVIAAERAGARTFLVPRKNFAEIEHEPGITVIPVDTFAAALAAVRGVE